MHLPLAMVLLFGGGTGLAFIFLPLMMINRYTRLMREVLSACMKWVMGSAYFMLFMLVSWMKLSHLMDAGFMLGVSFLVFNVGFLTFLFFRMYRSLKKLFNFGYRNSAYIQSIKKWPVRIFLSL
ncbi:MAG: hypothetical protein ACI9A7_001993 [Cyclobacteriaceae bacterium]|jgi:hypothetical protein